MSTALRHLQAMPRGLAHWMGSAAPSPEALLYGHLVQSLQPVPLDVPALAAALHLEGTAVARALFRLHHAGSIRTAAAAPAPAATTARRQGLQALEYHLMDLAMRSGARLVLADDAGLCIASVGVRPDEAQAVAAGCDSGEAARWPLRMPLHLGRSSACLMAARALPDDEPALLQLARSLFNLH